MNFFKNLSLKVKLIIFFFVITFSIVIPYGFVMYSVSKGILSKGAIKNLEMVNQNVNDILRSSIDVSVSNYLRGISEKNCEIVKYYYDRYKSGQISEREAKKVIKEVLGSQKIGKTGYIFVWNIKNAPSSIVLDLHPLIEGSNVANVDFVQDGYKLKNGYMEYKWKNPGEEKERDKSMYLTYFPQWDWIIVASSYKEEFLDLIDFNVIKKEINALKVGKSDYVTIVDYNGNVLVHPYLEGKNIIDLKDNTDKYFMKEICQNRSGIITYNWKKSKDEERNYKKFVIYKEFPKLNFIIITGLYEDELYSQQNNLI